MMSFFKEYLRFSKASVSVIINMSRVAKSAAFILILAVSTLQSAAQTKAQSSPFVPRLFAPYAPHYVAEPRVANSPRIDGLLQDGKLVLSLDDAIALALENNLDLAIARYNLAIADADIMRAKSGSNIRGVATGLVQGTPGGGIGGFGTGASGAGAGGTSGGAGGAGTGASGLVQSTLGVGAPVQSYDPSFTTSMNIEHGTFPLSNFVTTGVPLYQQNNAVANFSYAQAFATGTSFTVDFNNQRSTNNALYSTLVPEIDSNFRLTMRQHLLSGFGLGPNLRFIRIARNNREISDVAFRNQVVATVVQIENIYWDLVSAYQTVEVNEQSVALAQKLVTDDQAREKIGDIAPIEVTRAEGELAERKEELLDAQTQLQLQELLMKNAVTRNLSDHMLAAAPVIPTDVVDLPVNESVEPSEDLTNDALALRPELVQARIDLKNRGISRKAAANALLPSLDLVAWYGGSGLAGAQNPLNTTAVPGFPNTGFRNALTSLIQNDYPDYGVGFSVSIPIRNRAALSDQIRSELEYRQAQMRVLQLQNQIGIEVRNARFAVQQNRVRVGTARHARDLAQHMFDIERRRFALGASTSNDILSRQRDLAQAEATLVNAMSKYAKSRVELDRATGNLLSRYHIVLDDAERGVVGALPTVPDVRRSAALPLEFPPNTPGYGVE